MIHDKGMENRRRLWCFSTRGNFSDAEEARFNIKYQTRGRTARPGRRRHSSSARTSRMRIKSFIAVVSLIIGFAGVVAETPARGAEVDVHAALQRWVEALGSGKGEA